jgi:hypothetical protein
MFANKFEAQFAGSYANYNNISQFEPAAALVTECFPFIPDYK